MTNTEAEAQNLPEINKAAQTLGRLGGKSKTEAKKLASRENGKLGGRPRKQPEKP